ncbi:uncharacterized protein MYCFIDRAFT_84745 [Pseudocercospora fijiensis CIRAD86]|uniref:Uncharacterized protein n=1 Tax=Pseudocercospora fijiensis (strain CIRAD86) TaxID=383855 RepID=M2ZXL3_PSEFD|nr:uncharacterized protein MYCFIDRAFT_84745 [Pseudocercospora fijiensis CIRAD86]EME76831.1 hypothetical protein MYCFIDRAFT_84745 [Pseudocercospora fijiensis CIRAD86]
MGMHAGLMRACEGQLLKDFDPSGTFRQLNDDKIETRLDNAIPDGSDVDNLGDRVRRRDVFMSGDNHDLGICLHALPLWHGPAESKIIDVQEGVMAGGSSTSAEPNASAGRSSGSSKTWGNPSEMMLFCRFRNFGKFGRDHSQLKLEQPLQRISYEHSATARNDNINTPS